MNSRLTLAALVLSLSATTALAITSLGGAGTARTNARPSVRSVTPLAGVRVGSLAAVAIVNGGGGFNANNGFEYVHHPSTGIYCLRATDPGLKPTRRVALLTVEWGSSGGNDLSAFWNQGGCTFPEYAVQTYDPQTGTLTDDTSFVIAIP